MQNSSADALRGVIREIDLRFSAANDSHISGSHANYNDERELLLVGVKPTLEALLKGKDVPKSIGGAAFLVHKCIETATSPGCDWGNRAYFDMVYESYQALRPKVMAELDMQQEAQRGTPPEAGGSGFETATR